MAAASARVFSELQSHHLFADRLGRPGKGNDKGKVEVWSGLSSGTTWCRCRMPPALTRSTRIC
jgi:transposase